MEDEGRSRDDDRYFLGTVGLCLGPGGRYMIEEGHHSSCHAPFLHHHSTFLAKDTVEGRFVVLRMLVKTDELVADPVEGSTTIKDMLRSLPNAENHLMLHSDYFLHESEGTTHACYVYELHGWDLYYHTEFAGLCEGMPANWIWKIFKEALEALKLLHENGLVHGEFHHFAMIPTYPRLDAFDDAKVLDFYPPIEAGQPHYWIANGNGSGPEHHEPNLSFRLKLQLFGRTTLITDIEKHAGDASYTVSRFRQRCRSGPPELLKGQAGPGTDLWYLAEIMMNLIAGFLADFTMFSSGSYVHILDVEPLLGPLPEEYEPLLPPDEHAAHGEVSRDPPARRLLEEIQENRKESRNEQESIKEFGSCDFSDEEIHLAVDLLYRMFDYDPEKRISAAQALEHEFLKQQRPVARPHERD